MTIKPIIHEIFGSLKDDIAKFDPDQPRDENGQWASSSAKTMRDRHKPIKEAYKAEIKRIQSEFQKEIEPDLQRLAKEMGFSKVSKAKWVQSDRDEDDVDDTGMAMQVTLKGGIDKEEYIELTLFDKAVKVNWNDDIVEEINMKDLRKLPRKLSKARESYKKNPTAQHDHLWDK